MNSRPLCIVAGVKATEQNQEPVPKVMVTVYMRIPPALYWDFV
jgi:hypothetical protein